MKKQKLKALLRGIKGLTLLSGSMDTYITTVAEGASSAKRGSIFFCVKGVEKDGHDYIPQALAAGVSVLVVQKDVKPAKGVTIVKVDDCREAMFTAVDRFYSADKKKVRITGITGTKGKTTVSYLIEALIKEQTGKDCAVIGTIGFKVGKKVYPADNTTPSNITIHKLIAEAAGRGIKDVIIEASSHALDQGRLKNIKLDAAVMTNVTRDHFDYHKTYENYLAAKLKMVSECLKKGGLLAVNADDKSAADFIREGKKKEANIITYAEKAKADYKLLFFDVDVKGVDFEVEYGGKKHLFHSGLVGEHNIYNIMAALAVMDKRVSLKSAVKAVKEFKTVKGRLDKAYDGEFTVLVDFAHTPDSLEKILIALNQLKKARIITLFGAGGNRDKGKRPLMGAVAEKLSDVVIVTSDNPRHEKPEAIIKDVMAGIVDKKKAIVIADRGKAIKKAVEIAKEHDIIILAGKGHEEYQIIGDTKYPFNDAKEVKKAIRGLK